MYGHEGIRINMHVTHATSPHHGLFNLTSVQADIFIQMVLLVFAIIIY